MSCTHSQSVSLPSRHTVGLWVIRLIWALLLMVVSHTAYQSMNAHSLGSNEMSKHVHPCVHDTILDYSCSALHVANDSSPAGPYAQQDVSLRQWVPALPQHKCICSIIRSCGCRSGGLLVSSIRPKASVVPPEVHEQHGLCIKILFVSLHFSFYAISCLGSNCRSSFFIMQELAGCCPSCYYYQSACSSGHAMTRT